MTLNTDPSRILVNQSACIASALQRLTFTLFTSLTIFILAVKCFVRAVSPPSVIDDTTEVLC